MAEITELTLVEELTKLVKEGKKKRDIEKGIGLGQNSLSGILAGKKTFPKSKVGAGIEYIKKMGSFGMIEAIKAGAGTVINYNPDHLNDFKLFCASKKITPEQGIKFLEDYFDKLPEFLKWEQIKKALPEINSISEYSVKNEAVELGVDGIIDGVKIIVTDTESYDSEKLPNNFQDESSQYVKPKEEVKIPSPATELTKKEEKKYNFEGVKYLRIEEFTEYPLKEKPDSKTNWQGYNKWMKEKEIADNKIKIAFNNFKNKL